MRILLTGFEPFGAVKSNPSEFVVRKIAECARDGGDDLIAEILPTEFSAAGRKIRRLIRALRPDAVICLGVAASRQKICLERIALNMDDEALPDNAGLVRSGRPIVRDGPLAYQSTLPLKRMQQALAKAGIPAAISHHAGTYVCNHVFYMARHETERMNRGTLCGLLHLPPLREPGKKSKVRGMPLAKMIAAVECCIRLAGGSRIVRTSRRPR